jgi:hypothetical protein
MTSISIIFLFIFWKSQFEFCTPTTHIFQSKRKAFYPTNLTHCPEACMKPPFDMPMRGDPFDRVKLAKML